MFKYKVLLACLSALVMHSAVAQTLAEKQIYAQQEKYLAEEAAYLNKSCQSDIKVSMDWSNFKKAELTERDAAGICKEALLGAVRVCESSSEGMKAVQDNIKSVVCSRATPRNIELKAGVLNFGIDYNAVNDIDAVNDYLMNTL